MLLRPIIDRYYRSVKRRIFGRRRRRGFIASGRKASSIETSVLPEAYPAAIGIAGKLVSAGGSVQLRPGADFISLSSPGLNLSSIKISFGSVGSKPSSLVKISLTLPTLISASLSLRLPTTAPPTPNMPQHTAAKPHPTCSPHSHEDQADAPVPPSTTQAGPACPRTNPDFRTYPPSKSPKL